MVFFPAKTPFFVTRPMKRTHPNVSFAQFVNSSQQRTGVIDVVPFL